MTDIRTQIRALDGEWFHVIDTVYAGWRYGDPRGFHTQHQREHVEGDYKNPPPAGTYDKLYRRSLASLKCAPVNLGIEWREIVGVALREKLQRNGAIPLCVAVCRKHTHLLVKIPKGTKARIEMGHAKKHAGFEARDRGRTTKLWGKLGKELLVECQPHHGRVYHYILDHRDEGGWIWDGLNDSIRKPEGLLIPDGV